MPHALLLSPDDQAVSAITAVLEEMSVTCERPLDGPSAAKKLTSQSFDLVLVDCENLPAAKLIFDVCRRSQTGTNPVPIAIVDGRAGLPTAFRLGAELILTKPVAKDQARTTIRTAVNRVRKDEPVRTIHPFEDAPAPPVQPAIPEKAQAAAAAATSSPVPVESVPTAISAEPMATMSSATEEIAGPTAAPKPQPVSINEASRPTGVPPTEMFMPAKPAPAKASDDPILADLESDSPTPVFTSYAEPEKKKRGPLVAVLLLVLAGGGLYAAWMYQPGFREAAQPQIKRLIEMVRNLRGTPQATPPEPAPTPVPAKPTPSPAADTALPADATTTTVTTSPPSTIPATTDTTFPAPQTPPAASTAAAPASTTPIPPKPEASTEAKKNVIAALPSDTELPGEKTAVILSSQGAEKRLIRHTQPVYPAEARKAGTEGTVVLKAVVSEAGIVAGVRLVEGNPTLAVAAIGAVKQWHYRPYVRDGKALPFQTIVLVEFQRP
jgi:protein TonB